MFFFKASVVAAAALVAACSASSEKGAALLNAEYDKTTGRLQKLVVDSNKNGKPDSISYMDGTRIVRVEVDIDENGGVERWDIYNEDRTLQKVGLASRNDGVMDNQAFYSAAGVLQRIEVSTNRDARFNRTEFYESDVLIRSEEDTNGDGRPDKWETYAPVKVVTPGTPPYTITSSAFDETGGGKPTRRLIFGERGTLVRIEVDPESDGIFVPLRPLSGQSTK
jgi:hypothetical protein